jgi:hypothetical protein
MQQKSVGNQIYLGVYDEQEIGRYITNKQQENKQLFAIRNKNTDSMFYQL